MTGKLNKLLGSATRPRRLPYDYFIRYLVLKGMTVSGVLHSFKLVLPDKEQLAFISDEVESALCTSDDERAAAKQLKVATLYEEREKALAAVEAARDVSLRDFLNALLPSSNDAEVANLLADEGYKLPIAVIKEYRHYFCNTSHMTSQDWYFYIERLPQIDREFIGGSIVGGKNLYLWYLGAKPALTNQEILEQIRDHCYFRFLRLSRAEEVPVRELRTWLKGVFAAIDRLEGGDYTAGQVLDAFKRFLLESKKPVIPSWQEVLRTAALGKISVSKLPANRNTDEVVDVGDKQAEGPSSNKNGENRQGS